MTDGLSRAAAPGPPVLGIVACGTGGIEELRPCLVEPLVRRGWEVAVTLTPTAAAWLTDLGEIRPLEEVTGLPVRSIPRLPRHQRPHPPVDGWAVVPASANSVAKLALGIGDNQALAQVCEAIGTPDVPVVVFPRVNAAHARHPAWAGHLDALRRGRVQLVYGPGVWPLAEPRTPSPPLPWELIIETLVAQIAG
jgi:flavoprotein